MLNFKSNIVFLLVILYSYSGIAQENTIKKTDVTPDNIEYINTSLSLFVEAGNSGASFLLEYQTMINKYFSYSFQYNHIFGFRKQYSIYNYDTDRPQTDIFTLVGYYRIHIYKEKIFWDFGLGIGGINRTLNKYFDNTLNLVGNINFNLNIRLRKNLYLQTSAVPIIAPLGRFYISKNYRDKLTFDNIYAGVTFMEFGLKFKL